MGISRTTRVAPPALAASGGDDVYELDADDGLTYKVHVFESSGTLTVSAGSAWVQYLMCAGGGGGGGSTYRGGAGGGAGGLLQGHYLLTPASYSVVIGTGGAGGVGSANGANGTDTEALGFTAVGGGGGARNRNSRDSGNDGGSGGGSISLTPGRGVIGQGTDGSYASSPSAGLLGSTGAHGGGAGMPYLTDDLPREYASGVYDLGYNVGVRSAITGLPINYSRGGSAGLRNGRAFNDPALEPGQGGAGAHGDDALTRDGNAGADGIFIIRYPVRFT
jgi:hypothetical protein